MRSAYERVMAGLGRKELAILNDGPLEPLAEFKSSKALVEGSEALISSVSDFIVADITATPQRAQQTIVRINKFFRERNAGDSQKTLLAKFDMVFRARKAKSQNDLEDGERTENTGDFSARNAAETKADSPRSVTIEEAAEKIAQQTLFWRFYAILDPKSRASLGDFVISNKLCDAELEDAFRKRLSDERQNGEQNIRNLFAQSLKGTLDDFAWLHLLLLALLYNALFTQRAVAELQRRFDAISTRQEEENAKAQALSVDMNAIVEQQANAIKR